MKAISRLISNRFQLLSLINKNDDRTKLALCFLSSVSKILIVAREDIEDLQTDSDHYVDDTVGISIKVNKDDCL